MSNADRVMELYKGEIHSAEGQRICRERIHWICAQIQGKKVLDIGCSQGIVGFLAAREGREVIGIDVEEAAIQYAEAERALESATVQERLRFVHVDVFSPTLPAILGVDDFDTIVLGEVLEHQTNPRNFLERACEFLRPGARLIGSTPFGLHPHDDHKYTFYLSDFLAMVDGVASLRSLDVVAGYLRFTMGHRSEPGISLSLAESLKLDEQAFLERELRRHQTASKRADRIRVLEGKQDSLTRHVSSLSDQVAKLGSKLQGERTHILELQGKLSILRAELAEKDKTLKRQAALLAAANDKGTGRTALLRINNPKNSVLRRGLDAIESTVNLEVRTGRFLSQPQTSLQKTAARFRRAASPAPKKAEKARGAREPSPRVEAPQAKPRTEFAPYTPSVAPSPRGLKVASILDDFSHQCFEYEADLIPISPDGWREEIQREKPAFLFCESAWQGNAGKWKYTMSNYAKRESNPLRELLAWCKQRGLPTVFWNKEDPPNFEVFIDAAKDFDFIFTTDENCVPKYKERVGHDRVFALPFAAQPVIHNPVQDRIKREREVCFAGSWRADKYPDRVDDSEILLRPALERGLEIFDRHFGTENAEKFAFPEPYKSAVCGSLEYKQMLSAYRAYKTFLNVNSVKDSPTMFSRRVFELMACGTPVISSASEGVEDMLGKLVKSVTSEKEARESLALLLDDEDYRMRFAHTGVREILRKHTYARRLETILEAIGLPKPPLKRQRVTILAATNRPEQLDNLIASIRRQTHVDLEVIFLLNSDRFDVDAVKEATASLPNATVHSLPESFTLADCLNHGIDNSSGDWLAKFDDDDCYGAHYISDLLLSTEFTDAPVLGKYAYFCYALGSNQMALRNPSRANRHHPFVCGATLFIRRDVVESIRFTPVRQGTDSLFLKECVAQGLKIYSSDPYNYIHFRSDDMSEHTWKISDDQLLKGARLIGTELDLSEVMI